jgi:hypothetical protein
MTAPKRRWFSFSLRMLFVVVTAGAFSSWAVREFWPQEPEVLIVEVLNGWDRRVDEQPTVDRRPTKKSATH